MLKTESETPTESSESREAASVVHKRTELSEVQSAGPKRGRPKRQARAREISPAITPLVIGFTLLLVLIFLLGYFSVRRMDEVSFHVLDLEHQHTARLSLLLKLRLAVTKLNNEARARREAEARNEWKPPFDLRLRTAREEVNGLLRQLARPPLSNDPKWGAFRGDLESYVEVTEDLRRYSLNGFAKFRTVDTELDELLTSSTNEEEEIFRKSEAIQQEATRTIRLWSLIALVVGAIVAAGTVWEVQRRFRQMRRSMDEARRERLFSTQMLEGMVSAVAAIDENDRIRSANSAFFKIFPSASIGASVHERFATDEAMKMLEAATARRVDQAPYCGRWAVDENGREKSFDVYSSTLAIDGAQGQIVTLVDATEAAESELVVRRTESLAAVGQATTQVAHEIKNPLGSIRLGVSMLRDSVTDVDALRTIELVERGIKHLNKIVVDITQFSRQKPMDRTDVDLHSLINMSLDLVANRIQEKNTRIEKEFAGEKLHGQWDADQLRQVFVNLIANAIDASPDGAPITLSTQLLSVAPGGRDIAPKRFARITISDQGSGMDLSILEHLFEPFFSTKKRGTGLGLAIVRQIVDRHEGRISVESELSKGSRFTIDLPL